MLKAQGRRAMCLLLAATLRRASRCPHPDPLPKGEGTPFWRPRAAHAALRRYVVALDRASRPEAVQHHRQPHAGFRQLFLDDGRRGLLIPLPQAFVQRQHLLRDLTALHAALR